MRSIQNWRNAQQTTEMLELVMIFLLKPPLYKGHLDMLQMITVENPF